MAYIRGLGVSLPKHALTQQAAFEHARTCCSESMQNSRVLQRLYKRTEIAQRPIVLQDSPTEGIEKFFPTKCSENDQGPSTGQRMSRYAREIVPLALPAAEAAMENAGIKAGSIAQLVTVSCTGFFAPGLDLALLRELSLNAGVGRTHIGFMGCHAALNALRVASAFCNASNCNVLVCAAELCSMHFQYGWEANNLLANSLFADAAAAVVLSSQSSGKEWRVAASGSTVVPDSSEVMTWTIQDNGFAMTLSSRIPDLINLHLKEWLQKWLATQSLDISQINCWAIHPGGPRILDAVQESLSLSDEAMMASRSVFSECGNMSSPTVLFILNQLQNLQSKPPCVVLAFGPGLSIEAALLL